MTVCDPNREFTLFQPDIGGSALTERLGRAARHFPVGAEFFPDAEFVERVHALIAQIKADKQLANLLKGACLPICLPRLTVSDYGQSLDEFFIPAVGRAYSAQFSEPRRLFTNYRVGELAERVAIVDGSRHEQLLARMAEGPVVGIYFPNPLQGYSVPAQREQMSTLPEGFILSGPLDTATAWVMYPDVLARDYKTPGYDCAALQWRSSEYSLRFGAVDVGAGFGPWADLSDAGARCSGGLLFIG